jgi:DNA-binding XRE family transcriptional regulator
MRANLLRQAYGLRSRRSPTLPPTYPRSSTLFTVQPQRHDSARCVKRSPELSPERPLMTTFDPCRLVARRKERRLSQRALARMAGVSQSLIAEIERAKHPPSIASLTKIAEALGAASGDFEA